MLKNICYKWSQFILLIEILFVSLQTEMVTLRNIEKAVCDYYKVTHDDLYTQGNKEYPSNGAKSVFLYFLYKNKLRTFPQLKAMFYYRSQRTVEMRVATVTSAVTHNQGKYADDVKKINEMLNVKN
jgi:chromosomal replication initiation ATPase DnaA